MHVVITAAGKRTEHWTSLFAALCRRPDITLTVLAADISELTDRDLSRHAGRCERLRYHRVRHLLGEERTGHMASVLLGPGSGRLLASRRPDVVHVIGEAAYLSTWQVIRLLRRHWPGTPVTLYAAQNIVMRFPVPFSLLEQRAYGAVDHTFPVTPSALKVLRAKGYRGAATIVPLGVDTDVFSPCRPAPRPARSRRFTAGFVGRLEPHKGIRDLLDATELLDCDLLVIGDGSLAGDVGRAAARRGRGRVTLRSWVDHAELPGLLARMDALALPSVEVVQRNVVPWIGIPLREQFGRVLVEAMACGVPVVGSDVGEIPYVMGDAGLSFPAGDPAALADRLARLRDDRDLAQRLSSRGVARAAGYSWDRIADRLCHVWRGLAFPAHLPEKGPGPETRPGPEVQPRPEADLAHRVDPAHQEPKTQQQPAPRPRGRRTERL
ncbi:hypothetical protein GCM10023322_59370 [Rugosimonospora acidiphila]|uniref:Uncharacterized protein n=1 Tax=Rugosimonospora acidiphila TaxID=556531 RepID=A0ABP9SG45_9ACTN